MLWDLQGEQAEQYFKSWNTTVKLVWSVPRSTFTYLVEGFLGDGQTSLRNQILARYPGFFRALQVSPSREVRLNLRYLRRRTCMPQVDQFTSWRVRESLPVQQVPGDQQWRLGSLTYLLTTRQDQYTRVQDSKQITAMIDSLCST